MSVDNHRHCQESVCPAYYGYSNEAGATQHTWKTIDVLNLGNLYPQNNDWKAIFRSNATITDDLADILTTMNVTVGKIGDRITTTSNTVTGIDNRLTIVEGQMGQLTASTVRCYVAPNQAYFDANSGNGKTFTKHSYTEDGQTKYYYTLNGSWDETSPSWSYTYGTDHRIYPGDDNNIELQYRATTENKKKYPVFTLNQALQYLRRFRSASATTYYIRTQCGDYYYYTKTGTETISDRTYDTYENITQLIALSDAIGGSQLIIGPNLTTTNSTAKKGQRENMPCVQSNSNMVLSDVDDSNFVKVRFIWSDWPNQHSVDEWTISFQDSNNIIEGCGIVLLRHRPLAKYQTNNEYSRGTFVAISIRSGQTRFQNCVFRNCRICTSAPDNASCIAFNPSSVYSNSMNVWKQTDFKHDNIWKYFLPTIFVDDNTVEGTDVYISPNYISTGAGDNTSIKFNYPYIVFRNIKRTNPPVLINASNSFLLFLNYQYLSQIIFDYSINPSNQSFYNSELTNISWNRNSVPDTANANTPEKQGRIQIRTFEDKPTWLAAPPSIFRYNTAGYDGTHGVYNIITGNINNNPAMIWWNNQAGVLLNRAGGTGGTQSILPVLNQAMPDITKPSRTGYTFGGYYELVNGGGKQYYNETGTSARDWDQTGAATLYAKWIANS